MSTNYIPVNADDWSKMVEATKLAADLLVENKRLKAENERLRKAGDAMLGDYKETGVIFPPSQDAWLAAKEGGSK